MLHRFIPNVTPCGRTRREFLWEAGGGFAGLALIDLLSRDTGLGGAWHSRLESRVGGVW